MEINNIIENLENSNNKELRIVLDGLSKEFNASKEVSLKLTNNLESIKKEYLKAYENNKLNESEDNLKKLTKLDDDYESNKEVLNKVIKYLDGLKNNYDKVYKEYKIRIGG